MSDIVVSKKAQDISTMKRAPLIGTLLKIQQKLVDIGTEIKKIYETEEKIKEEEENAQTKFQELTPTMGNIFLIGLPIIPIIGIILQLIDDSYFSWGLVVIFTILGWIFWGIIIFSLDDTFFEGKKNEIKEKYIEENVVPLQKTLQKYNEELDQLLNNPDTIWAMKMIPEKYFDITVINCFISYLADRRADSYKEVVNLYEEEQHRLRMEELQQSILENAERSARIAEENAETLKRTEASVNSAARAAKISAVLNYATYRNIKKMRTK